MSARRSNGRPRLVDGARRGPAVHFRYQLRLQVKERGWIAPRSTDDPRGFIEQYAPGSVVEIDLGMGCALMDYDAVQIAEAVAQCGAVYLVSSAACGQPPHVEGGCAYNADGAMTLLRKAIDHVAAHRSTPAC